METDPEARFARFDWGSSGEWQHYLRNIYPQPTLEQVQRIQRRWYRQHIDPRLVSAFPQASRPVQSSTTYSTLTYLQLLLFALLLPVTPYGKFMHLATTGFFAGVVRKHGNPRLRIEYWMQVSRDEDFLSMCFCFLFLVFPYFPLAVVPVCLSTIRYYAEVCNEGSIAFPGFLKDVMLRIYAQRQKLDNIRSDLEIGLTILLFISMCTGRVSLLLFSIYIQFIHIKYVLTDSTRASFTRIRSVGDALTHRVPCLQAPWRKTVHFCAYTIPTERLQMICAVM